MSLWWSTNVKFASISLRFALIEMHLLDLWPIICTYQGILSSQQTSYLVGVLTGHTGRSASSSLLASNYVTRGRTAFSSPGDTSSPPQRSTTKEWRWWPGSSSTRTRAPQAQCVAIWWITIFKSAREADTPKRHERLTMQSCSLKTVPLPPLHVTSNFINSVMDSLFPDAAPCDHVTAFSAGFSQ